MIRKLSQSKLFIISSLLTYLFITNVNIAYGANSTTSELVSNTILPKTQSASLSHKDSTLFNTLPPTVVTTFPAGCYIIDMGQPTQTVNNGLKPYGLVYALIAAGIPVNWAIEPTKIKDGTDFIASSAGNINKAYKGGSFIINTVAYPDAIAIINTWKTNNAGLIVDGPTTASFNAPIYATLTIWPRAFLDAVNDVLITPYYANAGIPTSTYTINANPTFLPQCGSQIGTQDVYILPHADPQLWTRSWIESLQYFINNGGAMWAGCHAVSAMESISGCNFLSSTGLVLWENHIDSSPPYTYTNSVNPIMQFIGILDDATTNGSEEIYIPTTTWRNTTTVAVYDANYVNTDPNPDVSYTFPTNPAAVVAYGPAYGTAGLVMYEGGHSINKDNVTVAQNVAAQRAFFNFLLVVGTQPPNSLAPPNIVNQTTTTCSSVAFNFTPSGAAANYKYTWTAPTGTGFTGGTAQIAPQTSITQTLTNITSNPVTAIYTVTPRIGGCIGNPFTLTVTVYPAPTTITLTSGAGTNIVTTPIDVAMVNITYATTNATGVTFSGLPPGVTGTWASNIVTISGTPTAVGIYNYTVSVMGHNTCGGTSASGTITTYVCPTFSLLSTTTSSVNVCLGSSSLVTLTANPANLPVGNYLVSYEIQGVAQTPAVMIVTTAGTGSFVYTGFTTVGVRTITITNIASGLCSSLITTNNLDTVTVVAVSAAPTALAGSGATCTQITANWTALSGTIYYELDVSTSNTFASFVTGYNALNVGLVTSFNVTGLTIGTTYYYRVRAFNGLCISSNSGTITYATAAAPTAPTGLTTLVNACDELTVGWNAVSGATSYEIQWSTNASNFAIILGTVTGISSLTYTITGLISGTAYRYRVRAVNGCSSSAYTTSGSITAAGSVPTRPASITPSGILCNQFTVTWPAGTGATSYVLQWATNVGFTTGFGSVSGITALTYTITGLTPSTGYYIRIYSENGCGLSSVRNGSGTPNATTLAAAPAAPTGVATSAITCTQFTMSWTASAGAISYTVERALDSGFTTGLATVTGVLASPYTFTGLNSGTVYYYRVRAVSCGSSANATGSPAFITTTATLPATPTISTSGSLTFCETDSVTLGSSAGTTYLWSTGETTQFIFVTTPGNYTVQVTNASGCQSATSLPTTVVVQGLPTASAGGSQSICSNVTATVSGAAATNGTIAWTENGAGSITSGATTLTPTYTPAAGDAGNTVTLTMTVTSNNTCAPQTQTATYSINVTGAPSPPTVSTITQPSNCAAPTGSVLLINLPVGGVLNPGNISYSGTSYTVAGLNPGTYNFTITNGGCTSLNSADVVINSNGTTNNIWDGVGWSLGHIPDNDSERIIFNSDYTIATDLFGCSCLINPGVNVIVNSGIKLTITYDLNVATTSTITFENNASLVQIDNVDANNNTGEIRYKRNTSLKRYDYTYLSSPVEGQIVNNVTQAPLVTGPVYKWNPIVINPNGGQGNWENALGDTMVKAKGYTVRSPDSFPFTATTYYGLFKGVPNNGIINTPVSRGAMVEPIITIPPTIPPPPFIGNNGTIINPWDDNWNLIGNPYPSSIRGSQFLLDNQTKIEGNIRIWTHATLPSQSQAQPFYGSFGYNYTPNDYLSYSFTGTSCCPLAPNEIYIGAGQGFFVQMINGPAATDFVTFSNTLRGTSYDNSFFYRNANPSSASNTNVSIDVNNLKRNRIWLDLVNSSNQSSRILIGNIEGATNGKDNLFDANAETISSFSFYSLISIYKFIVQGRALPFDITDEVPLGIKVPTAGNYSIAIAAVDGAFVEKKVFVKDMLLNTVHNLKIAPYQFTSAAGQFDNRFKIVYHNATTLNKILDYENTVNVIANDIIEVQSTNEPIESIAVFDILGRTLGTYNKINANEFTISNLIKNNTTLLLKVKLQNGAVVDKKVIY